MDKRNAFTQEVPQHEYLDVRVVVLTNFIPPYRLPLLEELAKRVRELTVLVSTDVESNRSWVRDHGTLDVRRQRTLTFPRRWKHPAGFRDQTFVHVPWDTLLALRSIRPDVVISGELGFRSLLSGLACRFDPNRRLILWATLSERTEEGRGRVRRMLRHSLLRQADRVIVNGGSGARYVAGFGVASDRIDRVPYTAIREFATQAPPARPPTQIRRLLFVGQLTERKGLIPFVEAINDWSMGNPTRSLELVVVGTGPLSSALRAVPTSESFSIELHGEVHPADLPRLLADADALVFPTLADEWGLVVNEALAAGVPVIGSIHSQAVQELCREGISGWIFDPERSASTRQVIRRALNTEPQQLALMRVQARREAHSLTPELVADRLVDSIRSSLAGPQRRRC